MVIKEACFVPRNVGITVRERGELALENGRERRFLTYSYHSTSPRPPILRVNKELRQEGLRWYDLSFGTSMKSGSVTYIHPPKVYINWKVDWICLMSSHVALRDYHHSDISFLALCTQNKLQALAINLELTSWLAHARMSTFLRNVKDVVLFVSSCQRYNPQFSWKPFGWTRARDGVWTKGGSDVTVRRINAMIDKLIAAWHKDDGEMNRYSIGDTVLPAMPNLWAGRYVRGRF